MEFSGPQYLVKILVGDPPYSHIFTVHKYVITSRLLVFQDILNGEDREDPPTVVLRDVEPEIFAMMVRWFYSKRVELVAGKCAPLIQLVKLWLLAERLRVPKLQNAVIVNANSIYQYAIISPDKWDLVKEGFAYGITVGARDNPLRRYLLDLFATAATGGDLTFQDQEGFLALLPDGIAKDVVRAFLGRFTGQPLFVTFVKPPLSYFVVDPDPE